MGKELISNKHSRRYGALESMSGFETGKQRLSYSWSRAEVLESKTRTASPSRPLASGYADK